MRLDHLSYAAGIEGVGACAQRLGSALGAGFRDGGMHPSFGTRNFVLPLLNGVYVEVVEALDHPAADKAPLGRAVKRRSEQGGGWLAWVIAVDDIAPVEHRLGRASLLTHRRRPDGVALSWRQLGVLDMLDDPAMPFFIQWKMDLAQHPAAGGVDLGIERVEICGDQEKVWQWLGRPVAAMEFAVDWVDAPYPGLAAVHFSTPHGTVRLD